MKTSIPAFARLALVATAVIGLASCTQRTGSWDQAVPSTFTSFGLTSAAVVLDDPLHRAVTLVPKPGQTLDVGSLPIGHQLLAAQTSPDSTHLFVLSGGDTPRLSAQDQYPSLTVIDGTTANVGATQYTMTEPLANLAIDPEGQWAAAFAGSSSPTSFVENPNEIVLFNLTQPPSASNPISRTIRSFGGTPQHLVFTPTLHLPAGPRRLLVIETDRDVSLLDLDHVADMPPRPEITVQLTSGTDTTTLDPAGVAVVDGPPGTTQNAQIAVRTSNDTNVILLQLAASAPGSPNDFEPLINETDVGGIPSDFAFVYTDAGLRLAALVPATTSAVLVDPSTSVTENLAFPAPYANLSVVTSAAGGTSDGTDIALLWNAGTAGGVAFWTLGLAAGQPYRSVEVLGITDEIQSVVEVPQPNTNLELLETGGASDFYVLDLVARTAAPLETSGAATLSVSPDGQRVWAFVPQSSDLAEMSLTTLHPIPLYVQQPIAAAYDVARSDGGRGLIALDSDGSVGATVFDALAPDTATARSYAGLLLEGL
jgi:hypothetical protein